MAFGPKEAFEYSKEHLPFGAVAAVAGVLIAALIWSNLLSRVDYGEVSNGDGATAKRARCLAILGGDNGSSDNTIIPQLRTSQGSPFPLNPYYQVDKARCALAVYNDQAVLAFLGVLVLAGAAATSVLLSAGAAVHITRNRADPRLPEFTPPPKPDPEPPPPPQPAPKPTKILLGPGVVVRGPPISPDRRIDLANRTNRRLPC